MVDRSTQIEHLATLEESEGITPINYLKDRLTTDRVKEITPALFPHLSADAIFFLNKTVLAFDDLKQSVLGDIGRDISKHRVWDDRTPEITAAPGQTIEYHPAGLEKLERAVSLLIDPRGKFPRGVDLVFREEPILKQKDFPVYRTAINLEGATLTVCPSEITYYRDEEGRVVTKLTGLNREEARNKLSMDGIPVPKIASIIESGQRREPYYEVSSDGWIFKVSVANSEVVYQLAYTDYDKSGNKKTKVYSSSESMDNLCLNNYHDDGENCRRRFTHFLTMIRQNLVKPHPSHH